MTTERQTVALSPTFHTNVPLPCALLYSASLILSLKTNCFHLCIPAPSPTSTSPLGPPISKVSLTGHVVYAKRVKVSERREASDEHPRERSAAKWLQK